MVPMVAGPDQLVGHLLLLALHAGEGPLLPRQLTSIVMPFQAAWGMRLTAVSWKVAPS
jgi:hypothetical protein